MEYLTLIIIGVVCVAIVLTVILTLSNFKSKPPLVKVNDVDILFNTQQHGNLNVSLIISNTPSIKNKVKADSSVKVSAFTINWGDGTVETYTYDTDTKTVPHLYAIDRDYTIKITGDYTGITNSINEKQIIINDNLNINTLFADSLYLDSNNGIVNLDKLYPTLEKISIGENTFLNDILEETLLKFPKLSTLILNNKSLTSFNTQGFGNLTIFNINSNPEIENLDVTNLTNLEELFINNSGISNVSNLLFQIPNKDKLKILFCGNLGITGLFDITPFTNLEILDCTNNTGITGLDLINLTKLEILQVAGLTGLTQLVCRNTKLTTLNVNGLVNLENLGCTSNQYLETVTCFNTPKLKDLNLSSCNFNQTSANNLAVQLFNNGVNEGTLNLSAQRNAVINITYQMEELINKNSWNITV